MYLFEVNPLKVISKDPILFKCIYGTSFVRAVYMKIKGEKLRTKHYAGHKVLSQEEGNDILTRAILANKPYMFGRQGSVELQIATNALYKQKGIRKEIVMEDVAKGINSGYFANSPEEVELFLDEIIQSTTATDLFGCFFAGGIQEDYFIKKYCNESVRLTHLNMMDFWRYKVPFTSALKGKRVLVVSPLAELIEKQYKHREKLFENLNVLPEFELKTVKAIQSIMGAKDERAKTWIDGVEYMYHQSMQQVFDVAILGCGSYGMPLARRLKEQGKIVIYMGGVLQILFGIRGKRWDTVPEVRALYNEYWVSPSDEYIPLRAKEVEGGCYW